MDAARGLCVEFGVSGGAQPPAAAGWGAACFARRHCTRNEGARFMMIHARCDENAAMQIARCAGAQLVRDSGEAGWLETARRNAATTLADRWARGVRACGGCAVMGLRYQAASWLPQALQTH